MCGNLKKDDMKKMKRALGAGMMALIMAAVSAAGLADRHLLNTSVLVKEMPTSKTSGNMVKIALLLDTSNSMDGLINQAKAQLWDIVNKFSYARCGNSQRPELQIALYQYGNDGLAAGEGYIQQVLGFSNDLDEISQKLFSLSTNGGEEFCGEVIQTSLNQLDWGNNPDHLKLIFIAGNEPFTQGKFNYRDAVKRATAKDIVVNTIFCGNYEEGIATDWKTGAVLTGGEYVAIDHNQALVQIETPYDKTIMVLNKKLNATYVPYGSHGEAKTDMQSEQDVNAMELHQGVAIKRAVSKSSRLYSNASWDLLDASSEAGFDIDEIPRGQLPQSLRTKSKDEVMKYIDQKKNERLKVQNDIRETNALREKFLADSDKNTSGELKDALLDAIRRQAAKKNYSWE